MSSNGLTKKNQPKKSNMTIRSLWNNYLTDGWGNLTEVQLFRLKLVNAFSLVGVLFFIIFGITNIYGANQSTGFVELFFAFIGTLNIVYVRGSGNATFGGTVILTIMLLAFAILLTTGGIDESGWLWLFTFPPADFFLKRK